MTNYQQLQIRHQELLARQQNHEDITNDVIAYIQAVRSASGHIGSMRDREQLRAYLRYWGSYVYEKTGKYPSTELAPAPSSVENLWRNPQVVQLLLILGGGALVVILLIAIITGFSSRWVAEMVQTAQAPLLVSRTVEVVYVSATPEESVTAPTATVTPTVELTRQFTPGPTVDNTAQAALIGETAAPPESALVAKITNLVEGQEIGPRLVVSGLYANLQPGWTIHVLAQPLSLGGQRFPLAQSFSVPNDAPAGTWSISGQVMDGLSLERPETYNLQLVVALDENGRAALQEKSGGVEQSLPGVIPFPQVVTVRRGAYAALTGTRLLYSSFAAGSQQADLMSIRPDGSEPLRLTYTEELSELDARFSPNGQQIAFVGQQVGAAQTSAYSLWVMDSNGQNPRPLLNEANVRYEHPAWSRDGRYLVYSLWRVVKSGSIYANLFVYDLVSNTPVQLTEGYPSDQNPAWMPDGKQVVFNSVAKHSGTQGIFLVDVASGKIRNFFDTAKEDIQPDVSPDGKWVAFVAYDAAEGNRDIYVYEIKTGRVSQLTSGPETEWYPAWDPDSQTIYYQVTNQTQSAIWAVQVDGSGAHPLTDGKLTDVRPDAGVLDTFVPLRVEGK